MVNDMKIMTNLIEIEGYRFGYGFGIIKDTVLKFYYQSKNDNQFKECPPHEITKYRKFGYTTKIGA